MTSPRSTTYAKAPRHDAALINYRATHGIYPTGNHTLTLSKATLRVRLSQPATPHTRKSSDLLGADDLERLVDEDVVRPVDADVVDFVLAVAQLHQPVDDAPGVGGQRSFGRLIRGRSADDRTRPLTVARRDLTDLL